MSKLFIAWVFIIIQFAFAPVVWGQNTDSIGIFYDISVSNDVVYLTEGSIRNSIVKAINKQKPDRFERVFDKEDCLIILMISIISSEATQGGEETGYFYSIHGTISTYPRAEIDGIYFREHAAGISGDKFNAREDIASSGEGVIAGVFGDLDPYLGVVYESFLNGN